MNRVEELTLKLADGELATQESLELAALLASNAESRLQHLALLELEASLRAQQISADLTPSILSQLQAASIDPLADRIIARIKTGECEILAESEDDTPPAFLQSPETRGLAAGGEDPVFKNSGTSKGRSPETSMFPAWKWHLPLAIAASIALMFGLVVWYFGPRMGEPVVAAVSGEVKLERIGQTSPADATDGTLLRPGDALVTGTNSAATIAFGAEITRLDLGAKTTLQFVGANGGKRLMLRAGQLMADVARQRPFAPLKVKTPNAEARILGTRFKLVVNADSSELSVEQGRVLMTAHDGGTVTVAAGESTRVARGVELSALPATGQITHERWTNGVAGIQVNDLFEDARYPDHPSTRGSLSRLEVIAAPGRDAGGRIAGYVHPPITGDYVFFIAGTGDCIFRLSRDSDPQKALQVFDIAGPNNALWNDKPPRRSTPRRLIAGRRYFVECLYRNGPEGSRLAVAWQPQGGEREVIRGEFLSPLERRK